MARDFTRIFSDLHYGERSSRIRSLAQLRPLLDGPSALVLNGDTLDTRPGPHPELTAVWRGEVMEFFAPSRTGLPVTLVTGNHDPDLSPHHLHELADGKVFITHGDILYENIVPWSKDATRIRTLILAAMAALPPGTEHRLESRLLAFRRAVGSLTQRHHAERNLLRFALRYAGDSIWPPTRFLRVLRAWRELPARAESLVQRHRPHAKFVLLGHTHHAGVWRTPSGIVAINTGAFTFPLGAMAADVFADRLTVRRIMRRGGEYRPGAVVAEFPLADA